MYNIEWGYFFLTTTENLQQFEQDSLMLKKQEFTPEINDILLKLKDLRRNEPYDLAYLDWITKESTKWGMAKEIAENTVDHCLLNKSFEYIYSVVWTLFSYYNLFPEHQRCCFIKHGYPIKLKGMVQEYPEYIVYKEYEELYDTVKITDVEKIKRIVQDILTLDLPINKDNLKVTKDSVLFLQYSNY